MRRIFIGSAIVTALGIGVAVALLPSEPSSGAPSAPAPAPSPVVPSPAASPASGGVLAGLCEASAIVRMGDLYVVGDNETEDHLHTFALDFSPAGPRPLGAPVEDVEALTLVDGALLVVGSQSANKNGKRKPDREQVELEGAAPIRPDLTGCAPCEAARDLPPKEGGLSIEGAVSWSGALWLGVRSPIPGGETLLLRMEGTPTTTLRVAEPVPLDLGGLGVRDLAPYGTSLLVLAGPADATAAPHRVYRLDAPGAAPVLLPLDLPPGAEGIVVDGDSLVVVTDGDGEPGTPCKEPARWLRAPLPR